MPGGRAQKPGDVQVAMSGKTIEVINTDAEGRMVLADGVTYARNWSHPIPIIKATLTGAIGVALANVHVGAFGVPRDYLDQFLDSAESNQVPHIVGYQCSGVVVGVGENVTAFRARRSSGHDGRRRIARRTEGRGRSLHVEDPRRRLAGRCSVRAGALWHGG